MPSSGPPPILLVDAEGAAQALSVCEQTIRKLVADGELQAIRFGSRCVRYSMDDLRALIERRKGASE